GFRPALRGPRAHQQNGGHHQQALRRGHRCPGRPREAGQCPVAHVRALDPAVGRLRRQPPHARQRAHGRGRPRRR
ncbi:hypothetical protein BN1723_020587, partial [Verticillium longisporum]